MQANNVFEWLGQVFGTAIRFIIDSLVWLFTLLSNASSDFVNGFARALGVNSNLLSIAAVILGLCLIYLGVRAFIRKKLILGVVWIMLGLWLLSALMH